MDAKTLIQGYVIPNAGPIATVFAATVAAGVAVSFGRVQAKIAKQQADTARNKLQLELFDRRLVVYNAVMEAWRFVLKNGSFSLTEMEPYQTGISGVHWLFGQEVVDYVSEDFWDKLINLEMAAAYVMDARSKGREEQAAASNNISTLLKELTNEGAKIEAIFRPYLKLTH